ncbi:MAG TPA: sulfur carrier protein ThiS [Actinomycetota bacterium]|nr:sulfur carrier protein ThiS [Actinomycetota bacterium]
MNVTVNGKPRDVADGATVATLVESLGLGPRQIVVEHNGEAVERDRFVHVRLAPGDVLEIVRPVQGG